MRKNAELLLLGVAPESEKAISAGVKGFGAVTASVHDLDRSADLTNGSPDQIVVVCVDPDPERGFRAVTHLVTKHPQRPVVVVSQSKDSDLVLRAMRCGARDYAVLEPDVKDVIRAIMHIIGDRIGFAGAAVISVFSAKGGCGATTIATNLAGMIRKKRDERVILVDLNLQMGDSLLFLDLQSKYTIASAIRNMQRLDGDLLDELIAVHPSSKIHVLAQSDHIEDSDEVTPEKLEVLLDFLKRHYDVIVLDGLRGFEGLSLTALDASEQILLVLTQDIPAIKNARRCLDIFQRLDYAPSRIHVVLNRFQKNHKIDLTTISDTLGKAVEAQVTNDFPTIMGAINKGVLLVESSPRAKASEDISELVTLMLGGGQNIEPEKRGVLAGLFSKKR